MKRPFSGAQIISAAQAGSCERCLVVDPGVAQKERKQKYVEQQEILLQRLGWEYPNQYSVHVKKHARKQNVGQQMWSTSRFITSQ